MWLTHVDHSSSELPIVRAGSVLCTDLSALTDMNIYEHAPPKGYFKHDALASKPT